MNKLEEQVRLLAAGLGVSVSDPTEVISAEVLALARDGEKVKAIRRLREETGMGLVRAKRIVDEACALG